MTDIRPVQRFEPIEGDDYPYNTRVYRRLNPGFKIGAIQPAIPRYPNIHAKWGELCERFDSHYGNWEIVGKTEYDFFINISNDFYENADTLERYLKMYDSEMMEVTPGSKIKTTYDVHNATITEGQSEGADIDIPMDNPLDEKPTSKSKNQSNGESTNAQTGTTLVESTLAGSYTAQQLVKDYMDNFQPYIKIWLNFFTNSFRIYEVYK